MIPQKEFNLLTDYLQQFVGETVTYVPNPGNAGDSAIFFATVKMFEAIGLRYTIEMGTNVNVDGKIVVIGGGGAMANEESALTKVMNRALKSAKHVILLPHTAKEVDKTLSSAKNNLTIFCREKVTYNYLEQFDGLERHLVHDIVLSFKANEYTELFGFKDYFKLIGLYLKGIALNSATKFRLKDVLKVLNAGRITKRVIAASDKSVLNAFRVDEEKTNVEIPNINFDISSMYQLSINHPFLAEAATRMMLHTVSQFEEINTNRLHVAILSSLLGKKVNFYDNSYFKCRAVYLHSLEKHFPNVQFNPK